MESHKLPTRRRWLIAAILTLAFITGFGAIFSTWVKRQALDTNNWADTSTKLLANNTIRTAIGAYLVNEAFTNVNVTGELRKALPSQAQGLAGPAAAGLRQLANQAAPELLARPRVQDLWRTANVAAHKQLLNILEGGGNVVSTNQGVVTLNLRNLVNQLAANVGVGGKAAALTQKLPPSTGQLEILRSKDLQTAQDVAKGVKGLSILLTIVSFGLFALAIYLGHGNRRLMLRRVGWCWVGLGFLSLLVRRGAGNYVVNNLVSAESVKPAAHDTWMIGTSLLYDIAVAFVIFGLILVAAAWLAGATRSATAVRRAISPQLRERPGLVYGIAGGVYLLVLIWGPTPAFRNLIPIILIAAVIVIGIEALRHQTAQEFPDTQSGDTARAVKAWYQARRGHREAPAPATPAPVGDGDAARLAELEKLGVLHDRGVLTDEEFASQKALVLSHN